MNKIMNIFLFIIILIFFLSTYNFYSSNINIDAKEFNRLNIDKIIDNKITNLPILNNDTYNIIEFNDGYSNEIKNDKSKEPVIIVFEPEIVEENYVKSIESDHSDEPL